MKKYIVGIFVFWIILSVAGCASLQKKFTRKKKTPERAASVIYFQEGPYQKQYSNEYYYKTHFTMWKTWHDDLIEEIGGNSKRAARAASETVNNLMEMNRYLTPEKQEEFRPLFEEVKRLTAKIETKSLSPSEIPGTRSELEKYQRLIGNNFYFDKVKNDILPEVVDLGAPSAPQTS